jgi:hypothetical protein
VEEAIGKLPLQKPAHFPALPAARRPAGVTDRREIAIAVMKPLGFLLAGPLKKYRGIQARTVAQAMLRTAKRNLAGRHALQFGRNPGDGEVGSLRVKEFEGY